MKKLIAVLCVGVVLCFVAGMLVAAGDVKEGKGTVTAVDVAKKTLTGQGGGGTTIVFAVTADTKITDKDDKAIALADIKVGQGLMVTYTQDGDAATAVTIKIMPAGAMGGGKGGKGKGGGGGGGGGN